MEELELLCFKLITAAGTARSCSIEAVKEAKKGSFEEAKKLMEEGEKQFSSAHDIHSEILTKDAGGSESGNGSMLLMHAEDLLMSAETFKIMAVDLIDICKAMNELSQKVK